MNPHIYILILNWNGKALIKTCLDSVLAIDYSNYTILVIDNDSSDGSGELVKNDYPDIEYLQLKQNYGFAVGYNRCFEYLRDKKSNYILLLNNDTEVAPGILTSFIKAVDHYGSQHIYGAKIYYHHNSKKIWYAGGKINMKFGCISHRGIRQMDSNEYSFPMQTDYVTGCCLFLSMKTINHLEGFDEQFNMYGEDVDLCLRAKRKGYNCYYWPDAILQHHVSASLGGHLKLAKLIRKYRSLVRLWKKYNLNYYR